MPEKKKAEVQLRVIKSRAIGKADTSVQLAPQEAVNAGEWIAHPVDMIGLRNLVKNSSILPQCIHAYKNNICGYGIGVRYIDDVEETEEMAAEFSKAQEIIELLNTEQDTKEVFEDLIEARETYGIAYLEVIRDMAGNVVQIEFIRDTPSVTKTRQLDPYIETPYFHHGQEVSRRKRYCKYRQDVGGKTVYFKEFGDPRIMDNRSGEYLEKGKTLDLPYQANEILEFAIGTEPYGEVRWIGQVLGVDGSRKAETLNNNYFVNGRHTPLMIMIEGGTLTDESYEKLQEYMEDIKGEAGQHAFLLLETETTDRRIDFDNVEKPKVEVKELANILQKDELFQEYLDNNRRRVQSSFQLPDLYVGYTTDFNRATAQTAHEVTEEQVFQPERKSLAWAINNRLLNGYQFKYVEAYFLEPDISNPDDLAKMLTIANTAGGLTPNKAKDIVYSMLGETAEDFPDEWGNTPIAIQNKQAGAAPSDLSGMALAMQRQIEKAAIDHDDEIIPVLKEIRKLLMKMEENDNPSLISRLSGTIIKEGWNEEDHPRDERGRFTSGGGGGGSSDSPSEDGSGSGELSQYAKDKLAALSESLPQGAKDTYRRAVAAEAKITESLTKIADSVGAKMEGLDFRIKDADSYERKIKSDAAEKGKTLEEAAAGLSDIVRYTQVSSGDDLVSNATATLDALEKEGYTVSKFKNEWNNAGRAYNGINVQLQSPDGQKFELQFHTPESLEVKEKQMHPLYEKQRVLPKDSKEWKELDRQMWDISNSQERPKGIEGLRR